MYLLDSANEIIPQSQQASVPAVDGWDDGKFEASGVAYYLASMDTQGHLRLGYSTVDAAFEDIAEKFGVKKGTVKTMEIRSIHTTVPLQGAGNVETAARHPYQM